MMFFELLMFRSLVPLRSPTIGDSGILVAKIGSLG